MLHRLGFSVELLPRVRDEEAGASARDSKGVKGGGGNEGPSEGGGGRRDKPGLGRGRGSGVWVE